MFLNLRFHNGGSLPLAGQQQTADPVKVFVDGNACLFAGMQSLLTSRSTRAIGQHDNRPFITQKCFGGIKRVANRQVGCIELHRRIDKNTTIARRSIDWIQAQVPCGSDGDQEYGKYTNEGETLLSTFHRYKSVDVG